MAKVSKLCNRRERRVSRVRCGVRREAGISYFKAFSARPSKCKKV